MHIVAKNTTDGSTAEAMIWVESSRLWAVLRAFVLFTCLAFGFWLGLWFDKTNALLQAGFAGKKCCMFSGFRILLRLHAVFTPSVRLDIPKRADLKCKKHQHGLRILLKKSSTTSDEEKHSICSWGWLQVMQDFHREWYNH